MKDQIDGRAFREQDGGRWTGRRTDGYDLHYEFEVELQFDNGVVRGEGWDAFGQFRIFGRFDETNCWMAANYMGGMLVYDGGWTSQGPSWPAGIVGRWRTNDIAGGRGRFQILRCEDPVEPAT